MLIKIKTLKWSLVHHFLLRSYIFLLNTSLMAIFLVLSFQRSMTTSNIRKMKNWFFHSRMPLVAFWLDLFIYLHAFIYRHTCIQWRARRSYCFLSFSDATLNCKSNLNYIKYSSSWYSYQIRRTKNMRLTKFEKN
jgi:hypothetical protein